MLVYLPGPAGPDQIATKHLLVERNYAVCCTKDICDVRYTGVLPTELEFRNRQMYEMMRADAVVLDSELMEDTSFMLQIMQVCKWAGIVLLAYDELPAEAPGEKAMQEILEERDLLMVHTVPMSKRLRTQVKAARVRLEGWARAFDQKYGWFFTNGNKAYRQPTPVPYARPDEQPLTTTR